MSWIEGSDFLNSENNNSDISLAKIRAKFNVDDETLIKVAEMKEKSLIKAQENNSDNYEKSKDADNNEVSDDLKQKGNEFATPDGKGRQEVKEKHVASSKLSAIVNSKKGRALLLAGAGIAAVALLVINAPVALGAAAVTFVGSEVYKGRKGR